MFPKPAFSLHKEQMQGVGDTRLSYEDPQSPEALSGSLSEVSLPLGV